MQRAGTPGHLLGLQAGSKANGGSTRASTASGYSPSVHGSDANGGAGGGGGRGMVSTGHGARLLQRDYSRRSQSPHAGASEGSRRGSMLVLRDVSRRGSTLTLSPTDTPDVDRQAAYTK